MIMKIVCIGGLSDGETVEYKDSDGPQETVLLQDPRPRQYGLDEPPPSFVVAAPKREFYNLERVTSWQGATHLFYRFTDISSDDAITLLLHRYRNENRGGA